MSQNGATLILFKDDSKREVFLVFRSDYPIWGPTGGGMEPGETPQEAALREAFEETGFDIEINRYVGLYRHGNNSSARHSYLFEGRVIAGEFHPEFPGCRGKWFPVSRLPLSMTNRTKEKIFDCIKHPAGEFKKEGQPLSLRLNLHLLLLHPVTVAKFIVKRKLNSPK
ncbi:NUDIX hydrolase [Patescibacteria group bacterium]|nr:NUDIX hydrolase [Patescibacteria group bacterium]